MKKNVSQILNFILGDPELFTIENRIFNTVMFFISLTGIATLIYGLILDDNVYQITISILCGIVPGSCFLYSRIKRDYQKLITPANIYFYLALTAAWFFTNGVHGSLPFFFFVLVTYGNIFIKNPFRLYLPFIVLSVTITLVLEYYYPDLFMKYDNKTQEYFDIGISLILCLVINGSIVHFVFREYFRERASKEEILKQTIKDKEIIENAFKEIRILKGFLPICANCKKIRDNEGSWNHIETYISERSEAQFTHSMCPDCAIKLYPQCKFSFDKSK